MKSDIWAPPYRQNGMIITPREYSTESDQAPPIKASTVRFHPYNAKLSGLVFLWLSGLSIASAAQKVVGSIPREHTYWQKNV